MKLQYINFNKIVQGINKPVLILLFAIFLMLSVTVPLCEATSQGKSINDLLENSGIGKQEPKYLPVSDNGAPKEALADTIQGFTNVISGFSAGVAILFIVINAGKLIFAVGSSDEITKAKKGITWSLLGLLLVVFAFIIAKTVILFTFSGDLN